MSEFNVARATSVNVALFFSAFSALLAHVTLTRFLAFVTVFIAIKVALHLSVSVLVFVLPAVSLPLSLG